jgi:hypothetical protein
MPSCMPSVKLKNVVYDSSSSSSSSSSSNNNRRSSPYLAMAFSLRFL